MQSNKRPRLDSDAPQAGEEPEDVVRSEKNYISGGDFVIRADRTLFRLHSYHLKRATSSFDEVLLHDGSSNGPGRSDENPFVMDDDVRSEDMDALVWFFYESAYKCGDIPARFKIPTWHSILSVAEKYAMHQVARVACHALDRMNALSDVNKVALWVRHRLGHDWAYASLRRLIAREEPLSSADITSLGLHPAAHIASAREQLVRLSLGTQLAQLQKKPVPCESCTCTKCGRAATCFNGVHMCAAPSGSSWDLSGYQLSEDEYIAEDPGTVLHFFTCPRQLSPPISARIPPSALMVDSVVAFLDLFEGIEDAPPPSASRRFTKLNTDGDIFIQVEQSIFQIHSYHLIRASAVFADMFMLPTGDNALKEGSSVSDPIKLDIKAHDFENLLYFFYDSPYEWLPTVDSTTISMWKSILHLANMFDMSEVKEMALHALGRDGALADVHKVALCVEYGIKRTWAESAFSRVCVRPHTLTGDEVAELRPATVAGIIGAREEIIRTGGPTVANIERIVANHFLNGDTSPGG